MRIVLDTNILISAALLGSSIPSKVLDEVLEKHTLLASRESCAELADVIWREKLDPYTTPEERRVFLNTFAEEVTIVETTETVSVCRDPGDNMMLELAVSGQADLIITGDKDLLVLNPFRKIRILTPSEFLKPKR